MLLEEKDHILFASEQTGTRVCHGSILKADIQQQQK